MKEIDPKKVVLYGVAADMCVKHAVEGLLERQYEIYVVDDAIKGVDKEKTINLIEQWKIKGARKKIYCSQNIQNKPFSEY